MSLYGWSAIRRVTVFPRSGLISEWLVTREESRRIKNGHIAHFIAIARKASKTYQISSTANDSTDAAHRPRVSQVISRIAFVQTTNLALSQDCEQSKTT